MNEEYRHLRHAIRAQVEIIDQTIHSMESLKASLTAFGEQMDKVINK